MARSEGDRGGRSVNATIEPITGPPGRLDKLLAWALATGLAWLLRGANKRTMDQRLDIMEMTTAQLRRKLKIPDND